MYIRGVNSVSDAYYVIPDKSNSSEVPLTYNIHRRVTTDIIHPVLHIYRHSSTSVVVHSRKWRRHLTCYKSYEQFNICQQNVRRNWSVRGGGCCCLDCPDYLVLTGRNSISQCKLNVTTCTTCFHVQKLCILPTDSVCVFCRIRTIINNFFPKIY